MPGKVNPVIPEFVVSIAHRVYTNDMLISNLAGQGALDLNAYLPTIGHAMIDSIKLLIAANQALAGHLLNGIEIDSEKSAQLLMFNPSITTALLPIIGFNRAAMLAQEMRLKKIDIFSANQNLKLIPEEKLVELVKPNNLLKLGFSFREVID